jgi:glucosamine--fructose-6-phosphate aminotransferase (isomerizing)
MTYRCYEDIKGQADAWRAAIGAVEERIEAFRRLAGGADRVLISACGSPYFMGLANATLWREKRGVGVTVFPSSEAMIFPEIVIPDSGNPLLLVASRSGETTETVRAVEAFSRKFPGQTVLVGCRPDSALDDLADVSIVIPEAYEDVIPQTRSFCSMYLAAQYAVALLSDDEELARALRRLPDLLPEVLDRHERAVREVAESGWETAVFLGGGPLYGVAVEATLKLIEMSLTRAVAYHALEVRHGPRSVIDEQTLVVGLGSRRGADHERAVLEELSGLSRPHILSLFPEGAGPENASRLAVGEEAPEHALGLLYLPLLQLLAYHRAVRNGVNPDESHNLKSYIELPDGS